MSAQHKAPPDGKSCLSCWEDLGAENYVEYQAAEGGEWLPSGFCAMCVCYLQQTQWGVYTMALAKTTCKAEQRRLLDKGPPVNLKDKTALPCPEEGEVHALWFMNGNEYKSAKLEGSLVDEERQRYWDEQLAFKFDDEDEEASEEVVPPTPTSPLQHPASPSVSPPTPHR